MARDVRRRHGFEVPETRHPEWFADPPSPTGVVVSAMALLIVAVLAIAISLFPGNRVGVRLVAASVLVAAGIALSWHRIVANGESVGVEIVGLSLGALGGWLLARAGAGVPSFARWAPALALTVAIGAWPLIEWQARTGLVSWNFGWIVARGLWLVSPVSLVTLLFFVHGLDQRHRRPPPARTGWGRLRDPLVFAGLALAVWGSMMFLFRRLPASVVAVPVLAALVYGATFGLTSHQHFVTPAYRPGSRTRGSRGSDEPRQRLVPRPAPLLLGAVLMLAFIWTEDRDWASRRVLGDEWKDATGDRTLALVASVTCLLALLLATARYWWRERRELADGGSAAAG